MRHSTLLAAALALVLAAPALGRAYTVELEIAITADGEALAMKRLKNPGGTPVLMIHGFGSNLNEFDLPSASFARELAARNFDVWLANMRRVGKAPFRSTGRPGYTIDDVALLDVPALVERVRAVTGDRPFLVGHSLGAMVAYAYLQGGRYDRALVSKRLCLTWGGFVREDVYATRVTGDPALAAARNAGVRGLVAIAGPARMKWKVDASLVNFWRHSYWDYDITLEHLAWSPTGIAAAHATEEVPGGDFTDFITDDLVFLPYVGPQVRPFLALVAAQVGDTFLASHILYPPNMDGAILFEALDHAVDQTSGGIYRQFMDGIRHKTFREYHVFDPLRRPYVYADHYDRITAPALVIAGTKDKLCNDDVLEAEGFARLGSTDKTYVALDMGHLDLVLGIAAPAEVWARVAAWMAARP